MKTSQLTIANGSAAPRTKQTKLEAMTIYLLLTNRLEN